MASRHVAPPEAGHVGPEGLRDGFARTEGSACHVGRFAANVTYLMAATLALSGCVATPQRPDLQSPTLRLTPAALDAELVLQQRLTVSRDGHTQQADALLEIDAQTLRLVLLVGPRRLLTLSFDGERVDEQRDPALPAALDGSHFVNDIQLAYWPAESIRAALPPGWTLDDAALTRTLRDAGAPVVRIRYSQLPRWLGRIDLDHQRAGYHLRIESVAAP